MTPTFATDSAHTMAPAQYDRAGKHLALKRGIENHLRPPRHGLTVSFPVKMDDGAIWIFTGHRVHHSTVRGPTKGSIPLSPGCHARRGAGAGHVDDLEVCASDDGTSRQA